jgi:hypothetical protein
VVITVLTELVHREELRHTQHRNRDVAGRIEHAIVCKRATIQPPVCFQRKREIDAADQQSLQMKSSTISQTCWQRGGST